MTIEFAVGFPGPIIEKEDILVTKKREKEDDYKCEKVRKLNLIRSLIYCVGRKSYVNFQNYSFLRKVALTASLRKKLNLNINTSFALQITFSPNLPTTTLSRVSGRLPIC